MRLTFPGSQSVQVAEGLNGNENFPTSHTTQAVEPSSDFSPPLGMPQSTQALHPERHASVGAESRFDFFPASHDSQASPGKLEYFPAAHG